MKKVAISTAFLFVLISVLSCPLDMGAFPESTPWGVVDITSTNARFYWTVVPSYQYHLYVRLGTQIDVHRLSDKKDVSIDVSTIMADKTLAQQTYDVFFDVPTVIGGQGAFNCNVSHPYISETEIEASNEALCYSDLSPDTWYAIGLTAGTDIQYPHLYPTTGYRTCILFKTLP